MMNSFGEDREIAACAVSMAFMVELENVRIQE
jgi:hypothetical protein